MAMNIKQNGDAVIKSPFKDSSDTLLRRITVGENRLISIKQDDGCETDHIVLTRCEAESLVKWLQDVIPSMKHVNK